MDEPLTRRQFATATVGLGTVGTLAGCQVQGSESLNCATQQSHAAEPTVGPDSSAPTLELFSDFQCPHCKDYYQSEIETLKEAASNGRIQLVHYDFPVPVGNLSEPAAYLGRAVSDIAGTDAFWHYSDYVYDHQSGLSLSTLRDAAAHAGLAEDTIDAQISANEYCAAVDGSRQHGVKLGVDGTPYMRFGGEVRQAIPASVILNSV